MIPLSDGRLLLLASDYISSQPCNLGMRHYISCASCPDFHFSHHRKTIHYDLNRIYSLPDPRAELHRSSNTNGSNRTSTLRSSWQPYYSEHTNLATMGFEPWSERHVGYSLELSSHSYVVRLHCHTSERSASR